MDASPSERASLAREATDDRHGTAAASTGVYRVAWWAATAGVHGGRTEVAAGGLSTEGVTMRHILLGLTKRAAPALVVGALAAPTAGAQSVQDLRSPDARDAPRRVQSSPDLRSPDSQDAAQGRGAASAPQIVVMKVSRPHVSDSGGFDWADAGIGAGAAFGLMLLGVGATLVVAHRGRAGAKRSGRAAPPLGFDLKDPVREPPRPLNPELASRRDRRLPSTGARSGRHVTTHKATKEVDHEV
jgi:hypothetical protein